MYRIRRARKSDNQALIELEQQSLLDLGQKLVCIEHGPDFFSQSRLQAHPHFLVAEEKGRLVAVIAGAWYDTLVRGKPHRLLYVHRERVHTEHQRKGLGRALALELFRRLKRWNVQTPYWYISPDNERSIAFGGMSPALATAVRLHLQTGLRPEKPQKMRLVPRDEIKTLVGLFNSTQAGKELFKPYTAASLNKRLSRLPDYGWRNIYGSFDSSELTAAVGMWDQGESVRVTTTDKASGHKAVVRRLAVADYGFLPGREGDLAVLLREASVMARKMNRQEVVVSIPAASRLPGLLADLQPRLDRLSLFIPGLSTEYAGNDVWVDPIYL